MTGPPVLIPHASGTNRDEEAARAVEMAGGDPRIVHVNELRRGDVTFADHGALLIPGGFSYGDALGAGGRLALELRTWFGAEVESMVRAGKPILGICNGFQVLVKAGLLPGPMEQRRDVTLSHNQSGKFECRWVTLLVEPSVRSSWLAPIGGALIRCPVAHGEGRVMTVSDSATEGLEANGRVAFTYRNAGARPSNGGSAPAAGDYPANPNGSVRDIAGLCDRTGAVVGLMPHPEDHIIDWQRPSGPAGGSGLPLFEAFVAAAR